MSADNNVQCVVCGSAEAFVFFDFSLNGKKEVAAMLVVQVGTYSKENFKNSVEITPQWTPILMDSPILFFD